MIDWTDAEDMFGLLLDYVADERNDASDPERRQFLSTLLDSISELQERFPRLTAAERIETLRELRRSIDRDFEDDPVAQHFDDFVVELQRLDMCRG